MFEIGNIVTLRSGGHSMTVVGVNHETIDCAWSVEDDIKSASFHPRVLRIDLDKQIAEDVLGVEQLKTMSTEIEKHLDDVTNGVWLPDAIKAAVKLGYVRR